MQAPNIQFNPTADNKFGAEGYLQYRYAFVFYFFGDENE